MKGQSAEDIATDGRVNEDALKELLGTVTQHCPDSGLLHFWVNPSTNSDGADEKTALDREVQDLIIYQRGSTKPSECDALQDIDPQSPYFQELVSQYMSTQSIPTSVAVYIESIGFKIPIRSCANHTTAHM